MSAVWAAVISGLSAIICTLITIYHREIGYLLSRSKRSVSGTWDGNAEDISVRGHFRYESSLTYEVSAEITQRGSQVTFQGTSKADKPYSITGSGWMKDDYVLVVLRNRNKGVNDFGVAILHFLGTGQDLKGYYLGKRLREQGLVLAKIELRKVT